MKLIIGLGNPGKEYEKTRHNIGFTIVESFIKELHFEPFHKETKFQSEIAIGNGGNEKIIVAKPLTFMNLSGEAIVKILQFYNIPLENCLVIYDDVDLALGSIRIRKNGSAGTHNGMKSIIACTGSKNFPRMRFGIESRGVTAPEKQETTSFVLSQFLESEKEILEIGLKKATQALKISVSEGLEKAMNQYNK